MKRLLKHLNIIVRDRAVKGSIGIDGGTIAFVSLDGAPVEDADGGDFVEREQLLLQIPADFEPDEVEDFEFKYLAFPSFFNAHTHISMTLLRNIADGMPLMEWLETKIWPIEAKLTERDIYYGALVGMAELIHSGCSAFRDMYDAEGKVAEATNLAGLRGYLGQGLIMPTEEDLKKLEIAETVYQECHGVGRVKGEIAPHAPYTCTSKAMIQAKALAEKHGLYYHIHLSESDDEVNASLNEFGVTPTKRLSDLGVLNKRSALAHCSKVSDEDIAIIAKSGASVLLNPASNLKLGNGVARVADMRKQGINLALGTDGASSNNNLNMMEELHLASLLYGEKPHEVLETATIGGARSAGEDHLGLIKEGFLADIAFLDLSGANLVPHGNLVSALCYSAAASDVAHLMVDGEYVMKHRTILTFDEEAVKKEVRAIVEKLLGETL